LRYRQISQDVAKHTDASFALRARVLALFDGEWLPARVARANADGTYRVIWIVDRTFTDGLPASSLRAPTAAEAPRRGRRLAAADCAEIARVREDSPLSSARSSASTKAPDGEEVPRTRGKRSSAKACGADAPVAAKLVEACERVPKRRRKGPAGEAPAQDMPLRADLVSRGYVEFLGGLPKWELIDFVEECYDRFADIIIQELEGLRDVWAPCPGSRERYGAFAAAKATERLSEFGIAVYSPSDSQAQEFPYESTGPRWYISLTPLALRLYGAKGAPSPPAELWELLCGHEADVASDLRARGLGWTLVPPGSDPQALHADIYGEGAHREPGRTRWPHVLWKRRRGELCTTELVPGGFTEGGSEERHFDMIRRVRAPLVIMDSEALHRGSATSSEGWGSTLSLELCTASGWSAWQEFATGGTTKDPSSPLDWRMLRIRRPRKGVAAAGGTASHGAAGSRCLLKAEPVPSLPPAPWAQREGKARLAQEQRVWEGVGSAA